MQDPVFGPYKDAIFLVESEFVVEVWERTSFLGNGTRQVDALKNGTGLLETQHFFTNTKVDDLRGKDLIASAFHFPPYTKADPVSGEVIEVNADLEGNPEVVNSDPYGDGWMIKIKVANKGDLLISADEYKDEVGG